MQKAKIREVKIRLTESILERIDYLRIADGQTRNAFIRSAISRAIKNWKVPTDNESVWPACHHCGRHHDPAHFHGE